MKTTSAQRHRNRRQRLTEQGLAEVRIWVYPHQRDAIREIATDMRLRGPRHS
jgi:hypothetical protein